MPSADDKATNLRRSDRQRKPSKRATSPYEAVRYTEPKKKPGPKPKKPRQSSVKSEPRNGSVEDEMPESELTGFLNDNKQPAAPTPKRPKIVSNDAVMSPNNDDIQVIGVKSSPTPKMAAVPRLVDPRVHAGGVLVAETRMVRFRNCSTDKPEIHIQSADFPDYDHVYIAENQRWSNAIRFHCLTCEGADGTSFAELEILADGSYRVFEFGKHCQPCFMRSKSFEGETVRFIENLLFARVPDTQKCTINADQTHLAVHHPRGDFCFSYSHEVAVNDLNGALYVSECGCETQAILTETDVWVNYYHNEDCPFRAQTRAESPRDTESSANGMPSSSTMVASDLFVDVSMPSDLNNSYWLASFSQHHQLPVDGRTAHTYWNRVDISKALSLWHPVVSNIGPIDTSALMAHLLTGSTANACLLLHYFKMRFQENYRILKVFDNVDYRKQYPLSPIVLSVLRFDGYCSALMEFVTRYFGFRVQVIRNGADFRHYGKWSGTPTTPVAIIQCVENDMYEIVVGMCGILK
uniref:CxC5 domain-containing protein n=1 Tax=Panagrellus redivivus TaxID=6233 RepID=A0A7E4W2C9_PANRE